jgi:ADP-ribose pyrophosphatase
VNSPETVLDTVTAALVAFGCPADTAPGMAAQLDKRARQLMTERAWSYDDALTHLLRLMAGGWAAQARGIRLPDPAPPMAAATTPAPTPVPATPPPNPPGPEIQPWPTLESRPAGDFRIFSVRSDLRVHPRTGRRHDFYIIDCVNWVNACAVTADGFLVMVEQFRHGSGTIELEVPGGMLDRHETDPVAAAERELREETGYSGTRARIIGEMFPNAAIMANRCHTVLIEDARCSHELELDPGEDIVVRLVPVDEVPRLVASGKIRHAIVLAALHHLDLWRRGFTAA